MVRRRLNLEKRVNGPWAPFESEIIGEKHVGWVIPIDNQKFRLQISPFHKDTREHVYILPERGMMPNTSKPVYVEGIERKEAKLDAKKRSVFGKYWRKYLFVEKLEEYKIRKTKPDISLDDFFAACSYNWNYANEDDLDKMIALQLVSCPSSIAGNGGLGSLSSRITKGGSFGKMYVSQLNNTFKAIVPSDFYSSHEVYRFKFLNREATKLGNITPSALRFRPSTFELNYVKPCTTVEQAIEFPNKYPVQIPLLVRHSSYNKKVNDYQYDILQYQLSALIHRPEFTDEKLKSFEKSVKKMIELKNNKVLDVDPFAINKLALAFSRLHLTDELESAEIRDATELLVNQWEDWEYYLEKQKDLTRYRQSLTSTSDVTAQFSPVEMDVYVALQKSHDETGNLWIEKSYLKENHFKGEKVDLEGSLRNLCDLKLVISKNNFNSFRLLENIR